MHITGIEIWLLNQLKHLFRSQIRESWARTGTVITAISQFQENFVSHH